MRVLATVTPSSEQLTIISRNQPGASLIRGAAGSGKTTTALLRLKFLAAAWLNRRRRLSIQDPVNVLVLTYNRTLRGYVEELAKTQINGDPNLILEIQTFGKWSYDLCGRPKLVSVPDRTNKIFDLSKALPYELDFICDEIEYVMGRFTPEEMAKYVGARRIGRGIAPRVDQAARQLIISDVINRYAAWKAKNNLMDWNDLAINLTRGRVGRGYDIVIADEAQDFSANQVRAILAQLADDHSLTFILDAAQRIYPRGFTWREAGIIPTNIYHLANNYRNTVEIAQFAQAILAGLEISDDGTLPDFSKCTRRGPKPILIKGKFNQQLDYIVNHIKNHVNLKEESIAILHPKGWFSHIMQYLSRARLPFVEITRKSDWPEGKENIALSTLHSVKGLEFDHVFIPGLNAEVTPHGSDEGDTQLENLRRLLAMAVGRARNSVIIGYKPGEASTLINFLHSDTYQGMSL